MMKVAVAAVAALGVMATAAHADSISTTGFPLNGTIGGPGGVHTIVIDGVTCKLKNSTQGGGQGQGCNYTLTGGVEAMGKGTIKSTTGNPGCSASCEP